MKKENKNKTILLIVIIVLAIAIVGISYAYYMAFLSGKNEHKIELASARLTYIEPDYNTDDGTAHFSIQATSDGNTSLAYAIQIEPDVNNTISFDDVLWQVSENVERNGYAYFTDKIYTQYTPYSCYKKLKGSNSPVAVLDEPCERVEEEIVTGSEIIDKKVKHYFYGYLTWTGESYEKSYNEAARSGEANLSISDIENNCSVMEYRYKNGEYVSNQGEIVEENGVTSCTDDNEYIYFYMREIMRKEGVTQSEYIQKYKSENSWVRDTGLVGETRNHILGANTIYIEKIYPNAVSGVIDFHKDFIVKARIPAEVIEPTTEDNGVENNTTVEFPQVVFKYKVNVFAVQLTQSPC